MNVSFSRHAKRRMKLYGISGDEVTQAIEQAECQAGANELLFRHPGIDYPVKVIFVLEGNRIMVVTSYPLKKGK